MKYFAISFLSSAFTAAVFFSAHVIAGSPDRISGLPAYSSTGDVGKVPVVQSNGSIGWSPIGPTSTTVGDVVAWGTSGGVLSLSDTGIPNANLVLVSRNVIAGTGLVGCGLLTSDITCAMSTVDNQALTVGGLLTAASGITVATGGVNFTKATTITVPSGMVSAVSWGDAAGAPIEHIDSLAKAIHFGESSYTIAFDSSSSFGAHSMTACNIAEAGCSPAVVTTSCNAPGFKFSGCFGDTLVFNAAGGKDYIDVKATQSITFVQSSGNNYVQVPTGQADAWHLNDAGGNSYFGVNSSTPGVTIGQSLTTNALSTNGNTTLANGGYSTTVAGNLYVGGFVQFNNTGVAINVSYPSNGGGAFSNPARIAGFDNDYGAFTRSNSADFLELYGVQSNLAAPTNYKGERLSSTVTAASGVTGASTTTINITSLALGAGDWDVTGICGLDTNITGTQFACGLSTTSATMPGASAKGDSWVETPTVSTSVADSTLSVSGFQVLQLSPTTYYLVAKCTDSAGTCTFYGRISARRMR